MVQAQIAYGRAVSEQDLAWIRRLIEHHSEWHRRRLSIELSQHWNWRTATGQLKDMAARTLLNKLEVRGLVSLPPRRRWQVPRLALQPRSNLPCGPISQPLAQLIPLQFLLLLPGQPERATFANYLAAYHYLPYAGPVGENCQSLVRDRHGRDLACVLFGAAAWKSRPRDEFIGWNDHQRQRNLPLLANNSRFLILPWVQVPHLASPVR
jgi:hypothetical protein